MILACSWDSDGSLSSDLEMQLRDGDPNDQVALLLDSLWSNALLDHFCFSFAVVVQDICCVPSDLIFKKSVCLSDIKNSMSTTFDLLL